MPAPPPFVAHVVELLAPLGEVRPRRMFGGHGLYLDSLFIALIADERLYLKADAETRQAFQRAGCTPFAYSRSDQSAVTLGYWSAPDDALDSPQGMARSPSLALAAALRAKASSRSPTAVDQPATRPSARARKPSKARKSAVRR
jgi:DNA transformation protein